jgi:5'-nucleotidase
VPELRARGVNAIVVLIHQGGFNRGGANECIDLRGPIVDVVQRFDPAVTLVVSGHTHQAYVCRIGERLVTSAGAFGRFVTEIDLQFDKATGRVANASAVNRVVLPDTPKNAAQSALIERYVKLAGALDQPVGRVAAAFSRAQNPDGESKLGQLIADAHLAATKHAGAAIAFMNPGGIRAPLPFKDGGVITFSDVFSVYPFENTLVTMTLTGAEIEQILERQFTQDTPRVLSVSSGFGYGWDPNGSSGRRIVPGSVKIAGEPLQRERAYRVTVNSYMAAGGDRFDVFTRGRDRVTGGSSRQAIADYLHARSPLAPADERRIRRVD